MKAVMKLYLSKEEVTKIETMIDDIEDFLIDIENQGEFESMSSAYDNLVKAQDQLQLFLNKIEELDEEE